MRNIMKGLFLKPIACLFYLLIFSGCTLSDAPGLRILSDYYDFNTEGATEDWIVDFADYPTGEGDSLNYELKFAYTSLPGNLNSKKGIMISGNNHSDDLFMFMKKKITGLPPETVFSVIFQVELASNAPIGSVGAGGSPGESVFLKAGASTTEPQKISNGDLYKLNLDKGNQSTDGDDLVKLGHIGVSSNTNDYQLIVRTSENNPSPFYVRSNSEGEVWIIVGTDSGYEGITTLYYTRLNFLFTYTE